MEPVMITLGCIAIFGVAISLMVFVRQLCLSRDKQLNDKANYEALKLEAAELARFRQDLAEQERLTAHYYILGENKEAIKNLDDRIDAIFHQKMTLTTRYTDIMLAQTKTILSDESTIEKQALLIKLKEEVAKELDRLDTEIAHLQTKRTQLWQTHKGYQTRLLEQEKIRNAKLDELFLQQTLTLEKVMIGHASVAASFAKDTLEASNYSIKTLFATPLEYLFAYFRATPEPASEEVLTEKLRRESLLETLDDLNIQEDVASQRNVLVAQRANSLKTAGI
ncbi:MAG: hypothetical protein CMF38_06180 [Legionellaceae bacterium]|nr:hypothetical protein [Legionellaceae bacterium]HAF87645.1 hypothetical protein [Legionellales bacterium]HCA90078.1 hypothetical protein [Legionellales bacterium]|tara:strand:- start:2713 stop:3552 length:840 start_codon:yes stop_codon:yes gene_type:complete